MHRGATIVTGLVALAVCSAVPAVWANVVLATSNWDDGTTQGWTEDESFVQVAHSDGAGEGYLLTTFDSGRGAGEVESTVYTDASDFFAGDWTDTMWIEFDFWAQDVSPDYLEVWFEGTSGDVWRYALTPPAPSGWTDFSVGLGFSGWDYGEGMGNPGEGVFLSDLAAIDWIGVHIYDGTEDDNAYGLDNWQLMVPEPAEYALALSALAVIGLSVRKKRKKRQHIAA